jgi:hypothetical protein
MSEEAADVELYEQAVSLLRPGDRDLVGVVVHTDLPQTEEQAMNKLMKQVGEEISAHLVDGETYIYAGEDDDRFGAGQFHGRRLTDDEFVWECQQLLREGTFDLVFYWEAGDNHDAIVSDLQDLEQTVVPVTQDGFVLP